MTNSRRTSRGRAAARRLRNTGLNYVNLFAERINTTENAETFVPGGKTFGLQTNAA